jgi:hypothetical protein
VASRRIDRLLTGPDPSITTLSTVSRVTRQVTDTTRKPATTCTSLFASTIGHSAKCHRKSAVVTSTVSPSRPSRTHSPRERARTGSRSRAYIAITMPMTSSGAEIWISRSACGPSGSSRAGVMMPEPIAMSTAQTVTRRQ